MANEDFGMLSPDQVQQLANTISAAKNLTIQQEEIIKKVLAGETDIGKTRLAYLEQYFDTYSKNLDLIARKHSSLNDAFLILENKVAENSKKLAGDLTSFKQAIQDLTDAVGDATTTKKVVKDKSSPIDDSELQGSITKLVTIFRDAGNNAISYARKSTNKLLEIEKQYQEQRLAQLKQFGQAKRPGAINTKTGQQPKAIANAMRVSTDELATANQANDNEQIVVRSTADTKLNASLLREMFGKPEDEAKAIYAAAKHAAELQSNIISDSTDGPSNKELIDQVTKVFATLFESQRNELNVSAESLDFVQNSIDDIMQLEANLAAARIAIAKGNVDVESKAGKEYLDFIKKRNNAIYALAESHKQELLQLEHAMYQDQDTLVQRELEFRIQKLSEATKAETELQLQKNKTTTELDFTSDSKGKKELAKLRKTAVNSTEELKSRQALEAEMLAYKNRLEQDFRDQNNGQLLAKDAETIEKMYRNRLKAELKNLNEYTKARLHSEKLTGLKAFDPKLAEKLETEVAEKVDKKVRAIKQASNGKISQEQLEEVRRQALAEMDFREEHLAKLHKDNFIEESRLRIQQYDPKTFEALERKRAKKRADLEHEYLLKNHGQLFEEDKKAIDQIIDNMIDVTSTEGKQTLEEIGKQNIFEHSLDRLKNGLNAATGKAIEERISRRRRELIDEARAGNDGKLTEEDNERINEQLRAEIYVDDDSFKQYEDRITKLIFEQEKAEERLAKLKEVDAEKASEIELDMALLRVQKEAEAIRNNNGKLTQEALDAIDEEIARETTKRAAMYRVTAEQEAKVEADMASLRIQLEKDARDKYTDDQLQQELANIDTIVAYEKTKRLEALEAISDAERKENDLKRKKADPKALAILDEKNRQAAINQIKGNKKISKLTPEELKKIKDYKATEEKLTKEMQERLEKIELNSLKKQLAEEEKSRSRAGDQAIESAVSGPLTKENNLVERFKQLKELTKDETGEKVPGAGLTVAIKALSSLISKLDDTIAKVGSYKGDIDTRLHGSKQDKTKLGSYWDQLQRDMASIGAITPFFKQEDFANNIKALVDKGIAHDLKQRAFLMTIQEKIANTFDVADASLLRLVRLQQADSTAARLGMEATLNEFLNNMYETTEYLTDVAGSVRGSLEEMEALMGAKAATEVEYQVQKWMGSLYSVGMSSNAVQSIASALGQLAAGQIDPLTGGDGAGNLLIMAANKSGKSIADILTDGLDATETNKLLQATVDYLAEIAKSSENNNVVQQQLAGVFGVKASDLKAAVNLASDTKKVASDYMTYDNMLKELNNMANTMALRTSVGEMMTNIWDNVQFSLSSGVANNPISYFTYKMASLLDAVVGGIPLPGISVMGNMVNLRTSVADLMRVGAMSGGILSMLPDMISGLGTSFSGKAMLKKLGIDDGNNLKVVQRGNGRGSTAKSIDSAGSTSLNIGGGSSTLSDSGYVGNANTSDILDSTLQGAEDQKKSLMVEAKAAEEVHQIDNINVNVLKIYELLDEVASGKRSLRVRLSDYALSGDSNTNVNGWTSGTGTGGGVDNGSTSGTTGSGYGTTSDGYGTTNGGTTNGSASGYNTSSGGSYESSNSFSSGNGVSLGGWTVI